MHVLWVHTLAVPQGGCERCIRETADLLSARGVSSRLRYDVKSRVDPALIEPFEGALPTIDIPRQVAALQPDLVFVHQVPDRSWIEALGTIARPAVSRYMAEHAAAHGLDASRTRIVPLFTRAPPADGPPPTRPASSRGPAMRVRSRWESTA